MQCAGQVTIDAQTHSLHKRHVIIVPAGARVQLALTGSQPSYYDIRFEALLAETPEGRYNLLPLRESVELRVRNTRFVLRSVQEMEQLLSSGDRWQAMKANVRFQEMLIALLEQDERERTADVQRNIQRTVEYMERHLSEAITREQLAAIAGLSPDYYTRIFKQRYGKSPIAYLTEQRMRQAKRKMLQSDESVRSIALSLGFHDEFYFSRRFKAETGAAPTVYINRMKQEAKIASLNHLVTGHLMALGIEPYAAVINRAFPVATDLRNTLGIGQAEPELERLQEARPDLIVMRGDRETYPAFGARLMDQIAPTIVLDYAEDWRAHFQQIARMIGKRHEADRWMDRYQETARQLRSRLKAKWGEERVLIVGIGINGMCVFGRRNIGTVLYDDLHLAVPEGVSDIAHYKRITMEELLRYEADRVIFTCFQHDGSADAERKMREQLRKLLDSERWRERMREQGVKVHSLFDTRHLYTSYNAMSHQLLLGKAAEMFQLEAYDE